MRFDNLYPNVLWDAEEGLYKCWYSPFCVDHRSGGMTLEQRRHTRYTGPPDREMALCYATSRDGIAWQKPDLGLVDYRGSRANNIVLRGPHGAGVRKDPHEADPARRYKMFTSLEEQDLAVAFSADGIRWSRFHPCPAVNPYQVDGTHYHALWVEERGEYVGLHAAARPAQRRPPAEVGGIRGAWPPRQVGRTASPDFLHWSPATAVLEGTDENLQIYSMPVFRHGNLYLGLPAIHDQHTDRVWTELAWSPDTVTWHRVCPGSPLIANAGMVGSYDWGCVYAAACPVIRDDEIRLYYGASNYQHTSWRDGFPVPGDVAPRRLRLLRAGPRRPARQRGNRPARLERRRTARKRGPVPDRRARRLGDRSRRQPSPGPRGADGGAPSHARRQQPTLRYRRPYGRCRELARAAPPCAAGSRRPAPVHAQRRPPLFVRVRLQIRFRPPRPPR